MSETKRPKVPPESVQSSETLEAQLTDEERYLDKLQKSPPTDPVEVNKMFCSMLRAMNVCHFALHYKQPDDECETMDVLRGEYLIERAQSALAHIYGLLDVIQQMTGNDINWSKLSRKDERFIRRLF